MTSDKPTIFLDIDGVMVTTRQEYNDMHPKYHTSYFDEICVEVLNIIADNVTDLQLIISSDWRNNYSLNVLTLAFKEYGVKITIEGITPNLWGKKFKSMKQLEECRAAEILEYVESHKLTNWVAVDDLNLSPWIPENFAYCSRSTEGIKQSGVKNKILNILNK